MDGFAAGEGPVGNLVVDIAGFAQPGAEQRVLCGALFLRGFGVAAFADQPAQRAAFFDAQLVGADVFRTPGQHFVERLRQNGLRQL